MKAPTVETGCGWIRGHRRRDVLRFDGIPFAEPPVGPLRFSAPRPPTPWTGVRDATAPRPGALQRPGPALGTRPIGAIDEDCLHLNVVTPGLEGRRPVLVWIHGGGFVNGAASDPIHGGERLVRDGDLVLVTFDYRLGILGFLHSEAGSNLGILDQLLALRWVRDEIGAFGGDPDRVTLFGESAGALSILALMAMPEADDCFAQAVFQSGAAVGTLTPEQAARVRHQFADCIGSDDPAHWRSCSVEQLLDAQGEVATRIRRETGSGAFRPVVDGTRLLGDGTFAVTRSAHRGRAMIFGTNADEQRLFLDLRRRWSRDESAARLAFGLRNRMDAPLDAAHQVLEALSRLHPEEPEAFRLARAETDLYYRLPALGYARRRCEAAPTWNYLFSWASPALRGRLGACHALEIPFVFGTLDAPGMDRFAGSGPDAEALSAEMIAAWSAFARGGDPAAAIGDWLPWDPQRRRTWLPGAATPITDAPQEAQRAIWAALLPEADF
ncbi:MAG: carboxylesterase family protein [Pseudomonadales bacterium]|nr:carboxylesterase family protein [Pseudomonadales bacterium]